LGGGKAPEALGILAREAEQCIVARQEVGDGALGHGHATLDQGRRDFGNTAVWGVASGTHKGDDIEAARVLGQDEASFSFRPIGLVNLWAVGVEAAANLQGPA
jgi:hypothetical protein